MAYNNYQVDLKKCPRSCFGDSNTYCDVKTNVLDNLYCIFFQDPGYFCIL